MSTYYTEAEWLACLLQKKYRLRKRNLREYIAATCIQKRVRGFLFRISEKYVLSRVYAAIPWFWKQIIDRGREEEGGKTPVLESSSPVTHRQIRDLIYQTRDTLAGKKLKPDQTTPPVIATLPFGVLGNSFGERKKRVILHHDSPHLQSSPQSRSTRRMQFWLPSAFDLAPYASLADGRHIPLYGGNKRGHTSNSSSLHTFPLHLWPRQQKSYEQVETPFDIFDPHEFTFDIHEQSRGVLMCVRCEKRFRMITCVTCGSRGFCFQCALRSTTLCLL